jgi:hypothetical protein
MVIRKQPEEGTLITKMITQQPAITELDDKKKTHTTSKSDFDMT